MKTGMRIGKVVLLLTLLVGLMGLSACGLPSPPPPTYSLSVEIKLDPGMGAYEGCISNLQVHADSEEFGGIFAKVSKGNATILDLPMGEYKISASAMCERPAGESIEGWVVGESDGNTINVPTTETQTLTIKPHPQAQQQCQKCQR